MRKAQIAVAAAMILSAGRLAMGQALTDTFAQTNLVANSAAYDPEIVNPDFADSWGIAIRPAGAGGHMWVNNGFAGDSDEYMGDVNGSPLVQDGLTTVPLQAPQFTDRGVPFDTGIVYNASSDFAGQAALDEFPLSDQPSRNANTGVPSTYSGPAKFVFVTEDGCINAWGSNTANAMYQAPIIEDYSKASENFTTLGDAANPVFSGVAMSQNAITANEVGTPAGNHIYAADFRNNHINVFNDQWNNVTANYPFAEPASFQSLPLPGSGQIQPLHVFNTQDIGGDVYVTYAAFNPAGDEGFEEVDENGDGAVAEYTETGQLIKTFTDSTNPADKLDAPWGMAIAPAGFGPFGGDLLVTNFGDNGTISIFNNTTGDYIGKLDDVNGDPISIDGIWGLTFGNGLSLGDSSALYFTAGPNNEFDGLLGKLTYVSVPEPTSLSFIAFGGLAMMRRRHRRA